MPGFEYGTMDTGVTGGPNVKKPMDINEFMVRQSPPIPSGMVSSALTGELPGGGNFASPSTTPSTTPTGTDWGATMKSLAPLLAQLGAATSAGAQNPIMAGVGGVVSSALQGQQMNERLKKMVNEAVAGKEGFPGSPVSEISAGSGLETLGLNPEQITGLYKTGMELREKERAFPLAVTQTLSSAYNAIASGDLASANAAAKNLEMQLASMPENIKMAQTGKLIDIYKKIAEMSSTEATAAKTRAETTGIAPQAKATLEKTVAETGATKALESSRKSEENIAKFRYAPEYEAQRIRETRAGQMPFKGGVSGETAWVLNERSGVMEIRPSGKPGVAGGKGLKGPEIKTADDFASATMYEVAKRNFLTRVEKSGVKGTDALAMFMAAVRDDLGNIDNKVVLSYLSPAEQIAHAKIRDDAERAYATGMGMTPELMKTAQKHIQDISATPVVPPPVTPPPSKKVINPKTGTWETPTAAPAPTTKGTMLAPKNIIDAFIKQKKPATTGTQSYPVTVNGVTTRYTWDGKGKAYAIK